MGACRGKQVAAPPPRKTKPAVDTADSRNPGPASAPAPPLPPPHLMGVLERTRWQSTTRASRAAEVGRSSSDSAAAWLGLGSGSGSGSGLGSG